MIPTRAIVVTLATAIGALAYSASTSASFRESIVVRTQSVAEMRFEAFDVFIDSGPEALGAYQVELTTPGGRATLVEVAGGPSAAFDRPPYFDPQALLGGDRVVLGDFYTGPDAPRGRVPVATVRFSIDGPEAMQIGSRVMVAGNAAGRQINAIVEVVPSAR